MYDSSCVFDERKIKHVHRNAIIYIFVMFKVSAGGWTKIKNNVICQKGVHLCFVDFINVPWRQKSFRSIFNHAAVELKIIF